MSNYGNYAILEQLRYSNSRSLVGIAADSDEEAIAKFDQYAADSEMGKDVHILAVLAPTDLKIADDVPGTAIIGWSGRWRIVKGSV